MLGLAIGSRKGSLSADARPKRVKITMRVNNAKMASTAMNRYLLMEACGSLRCWLPPARDLKPQQTCYVAEYNNTKLYVRQKKICCPHSKYCLNVESYNDTMLVAIVGTRHIREMRLTWTIWRANWRQTAVYTCRHRGHATYSVCVGRVALNQTSCGDLSNKIKKINKKVTKAVILLTQMFKKTTGMQAV